MKRPLAAIAATLALAGCGASEEPAADRFQGAELQVAEQVGELQEAGEDRRPEDICANVLSRTLVDQLEAGGTTCGEEMRKAIEDADDFRLVVRDVTVEGDSATARVQRGDDGPETTFEFVRENGRWRATALSG